MDPERVPPLVPQPEITSPAHALYEDISGTVRPDPFIPSHPNVPLAQTAGRIYARNLYPYHDAGNLPTESPSFEDFEPIRPPSPVQLPSNPRQLERKTGINNGQFLNIFGCRKDPEEGDPEVGRRKEHHKEHTVEERLRPTLKAAMAEIAKAKRTENILNVATGMQILLGALTTSLSALAATGGKSTATATTALGALVTLVASYLARARNSNEPELSITRTKNLDQFIRECQDFKLDCGHLAGHDFDPELFRLRRKFEELLGNDASNHGVQKVAPPAVKT